jgi:hypothetical protein
MLVIGFVGTAHADESRAHFSGTRLVVEILGGELVGGLTTALTFRGMCDGTDCFGSAMLAFGADAAVKAASATRTSADRSRWRRSA